LYVESITLERVAVIDSMFGVATASGGYGAGPEEVWSNKAQRGTDKPLNGLIDQAADGTNLKNELQDAKQGRDAGAFEPDDEWGVEKGADKDF
jgi:hypothetical protein